MDGGVIHTRMSETFVACQSCGGLLRPLTICNLPNTIFTVPSPMFASDTYPHLSYLNQAQAATREQVLERTEVMVDTDESWKLVVYNDEVNTFDWVIECLVDICQHTVEQAEQCAWIIHTRGKYAVKLGSMDDLLPRRRALDDRGLSATVEQ